MLHPAPEPRPALKYQLLPPFPERRPGNAAVWWNRIPAERTNFFTEFNKAGGIWEKVEKWMEIPLGDPREKELRYQARECADQVPYSDMEHAARFESCDWELPIHDGGVIEMLLPELQQTRTYGRMLSTKARLETAEGKYDQAVRTLQIGFALARDVAKGPTLIHALVGTAIATMMADRVREMIQQPDCPNLYWALSTLPRPPIDFRPGFDAESHMLDLEIPDLQGLDKKQLPPEEWRALLLKLVEIPRRWESGGFAQEADTAVMTGLSLQGYPQAKQYLVEHGRSAAEVEAMPVAQVILLCSIGVYDELRDEQFKWLFLPYREATKGMERAERSLKKSLQRGARSFRSPACSCRRSTRASRPKRGSTGAWPNYEFWRPCGYTPPHMDNYPIGSLKSAKCRSPSIPTTESRSPITATGTKQSWAAKRAVPRACLGAVKPPWPIQERNHSQEINLETINPIHVFFCGARRAGAGPCRRTIRRRGQGHVDCSLCR